MSRDLIMAAEMRSNHVAEIVKLKALSRRFAGKSHVAEVPLPELCLDGTAIAPSLLLSHAGLSS
ncbi:hypothetical protein F2Q68_00015514 [Brassica cretica]|uniref:Uncharacterized protein n=3 Tax=Brassica cretica TaxID=69181 RepID=A0A8S9HRC8_BRACR|nr:hypothetical protein F2Q68_00015514 [Brassica cretica]KAF3604804.1 hypothetical protein DY000_02048120 [Brassica cretica]